MLRTLGMFGLSLAVVTVMGGCDNGDRAPARDPSTTTTTQPRAFTDPSAAGPHAQTVAPSTSPRSATIEQNRDEDTRVLVPPPMMDSDRAFTGKGSAADQQGQQAKTEKPLTDGQILGVALAANDGEVLMAEMAIKKGNMIEVKQFAAMMKTHHSAGSQKTKTVATKVKLDPADSDVSASLKSDVSSVIKDLHDKDAKAFDRAYMNAQVKAHKDVLIAIDNRMIPSVTNGEVRTFLTDMRKTVADHLIKAETLVKKVDQTPTASVSKGENQITKARGTEPHETPSHSKQDDQSKARSAEPSAPPKLSPDRH